MTWLLITSNNYSTTTSPSHTVINDKKIIILSIQILGVVKLLKLIMADLSARRLSVLHGHLKKQEVSLVYILCMHSIILLY